MNNAIVKISNESDMDLLIWNIFNVKIIFIFKLIIYVKEDLLQLLKNKYQ